MPTPKVDVRVALIAAGLLLASVPSWGAEKPAAAASSVMESSFPVPTAAQLQAGAKVAQTCAACHGADGNATSTEFPKLAGQHADYLLHALRSYQRGASGSTSVNARNNAVMTAMVKQLSDADMRNIAAWLAQQPSNLAVRR